MRFHRLFSVVHRVGMLLGLGAGLYMAGGNCGGADPEAIAVMVHMPTLPADTASLSVLALIDGRTAMQGFQITDSSQFSGFGVRLSKDQSGTLDLSIDVFDQNTCRLGTAAASTPIGPPLQADISATLTLPSMRDCPSPPPPVVCGQGDFCWSNPLPQGNLIRGLFALSPSAVWAVGDNGTLLFYDGKSWTSTASGISENLNGVWGSVSRDVFFVGDSGRILHWDGVSLKPQNSGVGTALRGIWGFSANDVYAVGDQGKLIHYDGTAWGAPIITPENLNAVWGGAANQILIAGDNGTILRYQGQGAAAPSKMAIPASAATTRFFGLGGSGSTLFAVGEGGTILSLKASDLSWQAVTPSLSNQTLNAVFGRSPTDIWAVGNGGTRLHFTGTWTDASNGDGVNANLLSLGGTAAALWAAGDAGTLLQKSSNLWTSSRQNAAQKPLRSVFGFAPNDVWAVGLGGLILHYDGQVWTSLASGTTENLNSIFGLNKNDVWAVGDNKTLLRYQGSQWTKLVVSEPLITDLHAVFGTPQGDIWIVGGTTSATDYPIVKFSAGVEASLAFTSASGPAPTLFSIWGASSTTLWAGGSAGAHAIVQIDNSGAGAANAFNFGETVRAMWGNSATDFWAVGDNGLILHGDGTTFTSNSGVTSANLSGVWGFSAQDVWAVGDSGTVLHNSTGTTFTSLGIRSGTRNLLRGVWGTSSTDLWSIGDNNTILHKNR